MGIVEIIEKCAKTPEGTKILDSIIKKHAIKNVKDLEDFTFKHFYSGRDLADFLEKGKVTSFDTVTEIDINETEIEYEIEVTMQVTMLLRGYIHKNFYPTILRQLKSSKCKID